MSYATAGILTSDKTILKENQGCIKQLFDFLPFPFSPSLTSFLFPSSLFPLPSPFSPLDFISKQLDFIPPPQGWGRQHLKRTSIIRNKKAEDSKDHMIRTMCRCERPVLWTWKRTGEQTDGHREKVKGSVAEMYRI